MAVRRMMIVIREPLGMAGTAKDNNDLQDTTQKTKDLATRTTQKAMG
jgi:hypothetical protein